MQASQNVVTIMMDFSDRRNLPPEVQENASRFGIQYLPTSVFALPNGTPIRTQVGPMEVEPLTQTLAWMNDTFAPDYAAALAKARPSTETSGQPRRIAVLTSDGSDFAKELIQTVFSEELSEAAGAYVWVLETQEGAAPRITVYQPDETRTEVSHREFRSLRDVVREALSGN